MEKLVLGGIDNFTPSYTNQKKGNHSYSGVINKSVPSTAAGTSEGGNS